MGILKRLKWKLSGGPSTEELREIPLMNEKWLVTEFEFPFPDSKFSELSRLHPKENPTREEVVLSFVYHALGELRKTKIPACYVNRKSNPPTALLMFADIREENEKFDGMVITENPRTSDDEYRLSPIESVKYQNCFRTIEKVLFTTFGVGSMRTEIMMEFCYDRLDIKGEPTKKKKHPTILITDHISYLMYSLKKRVELFSEHEEAEKWLVSERLFGESFKELIDFIMEKEGYSKDMGIYCSEVRKLLDKYNIH